MSKVDLGALEALEARASPARMLWKPCGSIADEDLVQAMRNNIKPMIAELRAAREVIKTVEWAGSSPESHGEDCDYWDFDAEAPSGEKCECGFTELREALNKYFEVVK